MASRPSKNSANNEPPGSSAEPQPTAKDIDLSRNREHPEGTLLTTDHGLPVTHTDDSLKAGPRGSLLLQDFHMREKITHFDHERIPERVVHARGAGAHGYFELYNPIPQLSRANIFNETGVKVPVFVRFSTVAGSRGSADTARDVRGFAVKFYTNEGNWDLVGNNMPVFFIQDGIKFPDFVHAVKPEPDREIPQAASAHDSFYDFISLQPETAHMLMWVMSDRAIPRSFRMMEGFGVHTFRLVNAEGASCLVKFHWKPLLGAHSLVWDEAQLLAGKDPDVHRRDLWDSIEAGDFPEWELGIQVISEEDQLKYGFDMLDATKLLAEELVPVQRIGKMTLNRNPDNFFAEVEQVAFHVGNLVPGIDVTNDPLMQVRLFSYLDTQLSRLGGPNFAEIPINRPIAPVHNHQQDAMHRQAINTGKANYHPNTIGGGSPQLAPMDRGFVPFAEPFSGVANRERSETFKDYFSQARMFLDSQSVAERQHIVEALRFELGKVERMEVRERVVSDILANIDPELAADVAAEIGVAASKAKGSDPKLPEGAAAASPALSLENQPKNTIATRKVGVLVADGYSHADVTAVETELMSQGAVVEFVSVKLGPVKSDADGSVEAIRSLRTTPSVMYDAVFVPGGAAGVAMLRSEWRARTFIEETFRHCKPIAAAGDGLDLLAEAGIVVSASDDPVTNVGVVTAASADSAEFTSAFVDAIMQHRHWSRADQQPELVK